MVIERVAIILCFVLFTLVFPVLISVVDGGGSVGNWKPVVQVQPV